MKEVFLNCYAVKNLGDDLFFKIISERYENNFYLMSSYKYNDFSPNAKILYRNFPKKVLDKSSKIFKIGKTTEQKLIDKSDIVVTLAGSVFMELEDNQKLNNWYKNLNKDYYILGSNIGPYHTEEFLDNVENIISNSKDTCLRDKKSFKLFENLDNVRVASDLIFSLDTSKYKTKEKRKVIFSVINCDKKEKQIGNSIRQDYEKKICEMIEFFQNKNYAVELMSFCQKEGDEEAIKSIIEKSNNKDIKTFFYNGNIEETLKEIASSKIIVGTRLHANILGLNMNKTIIPICYNNKTTEILKDINFSGKIIDINKINEFNVNCLTKKDLTYKCDVKFQKKDSLNHFKELDKILKLKEED